MQRHGLEGRRVSGAAESILLPESHNLKGLSFIGSRASGLFLLCLTFFFCKVGITSVPTSNFLLPDRCFVIVLVSIS